MKVAVFTPVGNAIFGLMIDFFTTVVFGAPALGSPRAMARVVAA